MTRAVLGVIVGYAVWSAIWLGGGALLFAEEAEALEGGTAVTEAGPLGALLGLSVVCSLAAGVLCAVLARPRHRGAVTVLAVLLLATGIAVQIGSWERMAVWYHLAFLALLAPVTILAGRLVPARPAR